MNNISFLMSALRSGGNPNIMLQRMARNNPQIGSFVQMVNGRSDQQLRLMAQNIAKEKGIDLDTFIREMGMQ